MHDASACLTMTVRASRKVYMYGSVCISCTCKVQVLCKCMCVRESPGLSVCPCASSMRMCVYIGVCEPVLLQLLHVHRAYNAQMQSVSIRQHTSAYVSILQHTPVQSIGVRALSPVGMLSDFSRWRKSERMPGGDKASTTND